MSDPSTAPKPFVFVLMPFAADFTDLYALGIKAAVADAGGYAERVDEQMFDGGIVERVCNQIAKADAIVAVMTGRNPNVFYEVGYAHALNKRCILATSIADEIPFDLKARPHIVYGNSTLKLRKELEPWLRWSFSQPKDSQQVTTSLAVQINHQLIPRTGEGEAPRIGFLPRKGKWLYVAVQNDAASKSAGVEQVQLLCDAPVPLFSGGQSVEWSKRAGPAPGMFVSQLTANIQSLPPGGLVNFTFGFSAEDRPPVGTFQFVLRLCRDQGSVDYPFSILIDEKMRRQMQNWQMEDE